MQILRNVAFGREYVIGYLRNAERGMKERGTGNGERERGTGIGERGISKTGNL